MHKNKSTHSLRKTVLALKETSEFYPPTQVHQRTNTTAEDGLFITVSAMRAVSLPQPSGVGFSTSVFCALAKSLLTLRKAESWSRWYLHEGCFLDESVISLAGSSESNIKPIDIILPAAEMQSSNRFVEMYLSILVRYFRTY